MAKFDFTRTFAALACTLVLSATCILGAVAPATSGISTSNAAARTFA